MTFWQRDFRKESQHQKMTSPTQSTCSASIDIIDIVWIGA